MVRIALGAVLALACTAPAFAARLDCRGADTMQGLAQRLAAEFVRGHRAAHIVVDTKENLSAQAFVDLVAGRTRCALFARELFGAERAAYHARFGVDPVVVPVALGSFATLHATHAIAIYVNAKNPLDKISTAQLRALLAAALPDMSQHLTRWGQLGLGGRGAQRPIHIYGMMLYRPSGSPPGIVNYLRQRLLNGAPMRGDIRRVDDRPHQPALAGIVAQVAGDVDGIGYSGFGFSDAGVKSLAVCTVARACVRGTAHTVADGRYALRRRIYLVFARGADGRAPRLARHFVRFALSARGQHIIAAGPEHFLPLPAAERRLARLQINARQYPRPEPFELDQLPAYRAHSVRLPPQAPYLDAKKRVTIVGYNDMRSMLATLDLLFTASHPNLRFDLDLKGTRTAPPALAGGRSLLAPMGAPFEAKARAAYRARTGSMPRAFAIAHDPLDPWARSSPLAVYVHRANPLAVLDRPMLARIFSGKVHAWRALGVRGPLARQPLHVYGLAPATPLARFFARKVLGRQALIVARSSGHSRSLMAQMASDPLAIGFADRNQASAQLKIVALGACARCRASTGRAADLVSGRYLLDRQLLIYVRATIDPIAREYLRLILSRQGQAAIYASAPHYLPLNARELARERAELARQ